MTELENNPSEGPELSQSTAADAPVIDSASDDHSEREGSDSDSQSAEPEFEEVDIDGEKVALPKTAAEKARAALLRQADYTRKTQELAAQRQQAEASFAEQQARIESERANIQTVARLVGLDEQYRQLAAVDLQSLYDTDPVQAGKVQARMMQVQQARADLVAQVQQQESQRALQTQEATARRLQQAAEVLGREIPNWSPAYAQELRSVAKSLGAEDRELDGITAPWIVRALHAHKVVAQMTAKAAKPPAPPPATPVRALTGGASRAVTDPDKMSTDEWMRREMEREAKRRRR